MFNSVVRLSPAATGLSMGVHSPSRMNRFVSGSNHCQPMKNSPGFQGWPSLFRSVSRMRKHCPSASTSVVRKFGGHAYSQAG